MEILRLFNAQTRAKVEVLRRSENDSAHAVDRGFALLPWAPASDPSLSPQAHRPAERLSIAAVGNSA
jgi:hypothetical protein